MEWYENMTKLERKQFWTVTVTCAAGSVLILLVPVICRFIF